MKAFSSFILFRLFGWKLINDFPQDIKKYLVIAAPHTSWMDFPIAILARMSSGTMIKFIGKGSLFKGPFGFIFRLLGGIPVDRSQNNNLVDSIVALFNSKEDFRLGLSPEGTRKKVTELKTGFYYIALKANVPIIPIAFDYGKKEVRVGDPLHVTGNYEEDMKIILPHFKGVIGKIPERSYIV